MQACSIAARLCAICPYSKCLKCCIWLMFITRSYWGDAVHPADRGHKVRGRECIAALSVVHTAVQMDCVVSGRVCSAVSSIDGAEDPQPL
jgi:hypothetical protein